MKLQCPTCGESGEADHYPAPAGEPRYCWECMRHGRGRVEVLEVIILHGRPKLPTTSPVEPAEERLPDHTKPTKSAKSPKKAKRRTA